MCKGRLGHKDKISRCRFFVVLGDGLVLLGMPDITFQDILIIMCKVVGDQQADRKLDSKNTAIKHP